MKIRVNSIVEILVTIFHLLLFAQATKWLRSASTENALSRLTCMSRGDIPAATRSPYMYLHVSFTSVAKESPSVRTSI